MTTRFEFNNFSAFPWPLMVWMLMAGFALGVFFYGTLWFVTGKILHSSRPVLWMLGGFSVRLAVVLSGLYWLSDGQWQRLLMCMVGFVAARMVVVRLSARWPSEEPDHKEVRDAS